MKRLVLFFGMAGALASCGPRTHMDGARQLITDYFDSLAFKVEIKSLKVADTIYTEMPADDSTYAALLGELKRIEDEETKFLREKNPPLSSPRLNEFWEQKRMAEQRAKDYKYSYEGDLVGYAYELIVWSDDMKLKEKVQSKWFIIDPECKRVSVKEAHFREKEREIAEMEEFTRLVRRTIR